MTRSRIVRCTPALCARSATARSRPRIPSLRVISWSHRLDVVVTDVRFTGSINALELTRRLKTNVRTAAVRIIVLTTVSRPHDADVALKAGADMFLEKPVPGSLRPRSRGLFQHTRRTCHQTSTWTPVYTSGTLDECRESHAPKAARPAVTASETISRKPIATTSPKQRRRSSRNALRCAPGFDFTRHIVFSAACSSRNAPVEATANATLPIVVARMPARR